VVAVAVWRAIEGIKIDVGKLLAGKRAA